MFSFSIANVEGKCKVIEAPDRLFKQIVTSLIMNRNRDVRIVKWFLESEADPKLQQLNLFRLLFCIFVNTSGHPDKSKPSS